MQEKKPRRRVAVPLDRLVGRSCDQLSDIARRLEQAVFPISDARGQHLAHAIAAIRLGQGLLRNVPANVPVSGGTSSAQVGCSADFCETRIAVESATKHRGQWENTPRRPYPQNEKVEDPK